MQLFSCTTYLNSFQLRRDVFSYAAFQAFKNNVADLKKNLGIEAVAHLQELWYFFDCFLSCWTASHFLAASNGFWFHQFEAYVLFALDAAAPETAAEMMSGSLNKFCVPWPCSFHLIMTVAVRHIGSQHGFCELCWMFMSSTPRSHLRACPKDNPSGVSPSVGLQWTGFFNAAL